VLRRYQRREQATTIYCTAAMTRLSERTAHYYRWLKQHRRARHSAPTTLPWCRKFITSRQRRPTSDDDRISANSATERSSERHWFRQYTLDSSVNMARNSIHPDLKHNSCKLHRDLTVRSLLYVCCSTCAVITVKTVVSHLCVVSFRIVLLAGTVFDPPAA